MRMGPFSNSKVITYINEHFVPLYVSNEDYEAGVFGIEERNLLRSIRANARKNGFQAGSVYVYLVDADLNVPDVMHVAAASTIDRLMPFLRRNVKHLNASGGKQLIESRPQLSLPVVHANQLLVRVAAMFQSREKIMTGDWIVLEEEDWLSFYPPTQVQSRDNQKWMIRDHVARKLLIQLYPYAENWDHSLDQISAAELHAEILEQNEENTIVSLRGKLDMTHQLYENKGRSSVSSELTGFVVLEPNKKPQVTLITGGAQFAGRPFEGLVQSVSTKR